MRLFISLHFSAMFCIIPAGLHRPTSHSSSRLLHRPGQETPCSDPLPGHNGTRLPRDSPCHRLSSAHRQNARMPLCVFQLLNYRTTGSNSRRLACGRRVHGAAVAAHRRCRAEIRGELHPHCRFAQRKALSPIHEASLYPAVSQHSSVPPFDVYFSFVDDS